MDVIVVPRTPKSAYNPKRQVSQLIRAHMHHAEAAASVPHRQKRGHSIKTEGEAAAYIAELTAGLHPRHAPKHTRQARRRTVKKAKTVRKVKTAKKKKTAKKATKSRRRTPSRRTRRAKHR